MAPLEEYRRKRRFNETPEPTGAAGKSKAAKKKTAKKRAAKALSFVVQKHDASRLHYDFRLELDGVLKSWAVPKGPSFDTHEKRLAVEVEDHPLDYAGFEGIIPPGQYGSGTVIVWDRGTWTPLGDPHESLAAGKLKFELEGEKLRGGWTLVRMRARGGEANNWLLIKEKDDEVRPLSEYDVLDDRPESVLSGRTIDETAASPGRVWNSNREENAEPAAKKRAAGTKKSATRKATAKKSPAKKTAASKGAAKKKTATKNKVKSASAAKSAPAKKSSRSRSAEEAAVPEAKKAAFLKGVEPQLATLVADVPADPDRLYEIKFDGYRLVAYVRDGSARLVTRNGLDWTARFRELATALGQLSVESAVLDGEAVALDEQGASRFELLQAALREKNSKNLVFYAFDLLYLDGYDLRGAALVDRKQALERVLAGKEKSRVRYVEHVVGDGVAFVESARRLGLEGAISKRPDAPYRGGRVGDWLKIKHSLREEFVIGGFTESTAVRRGVKAILVGSHDEQGDLIYSGKVGTGFDQAALDDLRERLMARQAEASPFANLDRNPVKEKTVWVRPELVAQVAYSNRTTDGLLRHPSFQGLREDKPAEKVTFERAKNAASAGGKKGARKTSSAPPRLATSSAGSDNAKANGKRHRAMTDDDVAELEGVTFTNPERVLYPEQGITKFALAKYYVEVADWVLPHVVNRPLSLVRCPQGAEGKCFFQKHAGAAVPDALLRLDIKEGEEPYLATKNLAGLLSLVQIGVLEIHIWGCRIDDLERPDRVVFDLDPDPSVGWPRVAEAARDFRQRLTDLGLVSFLKTTGGKGLHVVVPLDRRRGWEDVKAFAKALCERVRDDAPSQFTTKMSKAGRTGKIFLDYLRNDRGATFIAPYSTRSKSGAPVSTPIAWEELDAGARSDSFHVGNVADRLSALKRDPWEAMQETRQSLTAAMLKQVGAET
ncbi:MAG TPA: DNA ligase D [Pirellulaceae bacterium]|jgi:bifunctional non-homologous end joining protein LigD|nr:DNA ligase D [Pirellulaceae bacterium]